MQKQQVNFRKYPIDDRDKIAVYAKLRARHAATGNNYFTKLRISTTLALNGISDGIGEDMLHAATLGRLEADAYMRDVVHNMPLTLAAFGVLLEDFGDFSAVERSFQFSEVQTAIDDDIRGGAKGHDYMPKHRETAEAVTIAADMIKSREALEGVLLTILKKKSLVKIFILYSDGMPLDEIADITNNTYASVDHHMRRAKAKLQAAGLQAFLK